MHNMGNPVEVVATRSLTEGKFDKGDVPKWIGRREVEVPLERWMLPTPRLGNVRLPIFYHGKISGCDQLMGKIWQHFVVESERTTKLHIYACSRAPNCQFFTTPPHKHFSRLTW